MYRVFINPSNTHKRGYQLFGVSAPVKRDGDVFVGQLADISSRGFSSREVPERFKNTHGCILGNPQDAHKPLQLGVIHRCSLHRNAPRGVRISGPL